jgi:hypothetical protein
VLPHSLNFAVLDLKPSLQEVGSALSWVSSSPLPLLRHGVVANQVSESLLSQGAVTHHEQSTVGSIRQVSYRRRYDLIPSLEWSKLAAFIFILELCNFFEYLFFSEFDVSVNIAMKSLAITISRESGNCLFAT